MDKMKFFMALGCLMMFFVISDADSPGPDSMLHERLEMLQRRVEAQDLIIKKQQEVFKELFGQLITEIYDTMTLVHPNTDHETIMEEGFEKSVETMENSFKKLGIKVK